MPDFYYNMPVGILSSVHSLASWLKYSERREFEDMLTASMVCDFYNNNK